MAQRDRGQRPGERRVHLGGGPAQRPRLGGEVLALGQLAQRQFPAVGRALHERLEHAEYIGLRVEVREHPGRGGRDPRAALPGQRQRKLQIGVDPGDDPAQHLQDERISVDDRRVGLLRRHQARYQVLPYLLAPVVLEAQVTDAGPAAQGFQEDTGGARVVQRLVHRPAA